MEVFDANGQSRFGKLVDGYSVSYKKRGTTKTVSAMGATSVIGLRPGQVTLDGQSASVTVTTDDEALEITSSFTLDMQSKSLIIRRSVKNISGQSLTLMRTEQNLDPKVLGVGSKLGPELLKREASRRVIATGCTDQMIDLPPHRPPCPTYNCSENNILRAFLDTTSKKPFSLVWKCKKVFQATSSTSDNVVSEAHFVVGIRDR
jgi:hypothetical protein